MKIKNIALFLVLSLAKNAWTMGKLTLEDSSVAAPAYSLKADLEDHKTAITAYRETLYNHLQKKSPTFCALFQDMAHYEIDDTLLPEDKQPFLHRYNTLEHSVVVAKQFTTGLKTYKQAENLVASLDERSKYVGFVASLLHDIGKAGEPDCLKAPQSKRDKFVSNGDIIRFISKEDHERIGKEYLLEKRPYIFCDGKTLDVGDLFRDLDIANTTEKKMIAVLVGAHKEFDGVLERDLYERRQTNSKPVKTFEEYIRGIDKLACEAGLEQQWNEDLLFRKNLVRMAIVVNLADIVGVYFDTNEGAELPILGTCVIPPVRRNYSFVQTKKGPEAEESTRTKYCDRVLFGDPKFKDVRPAGAIVIAKELLANMLTGSEV